MLACMYRHVTSILVIFVSSFPEVVLNLDNCSHNCISKLMATSQERQNIKNIK